LDGLSSNLNLGESLFFLRKRKGISFPKEKISGARKAPDWGVGQEHLRPDGNPLHGSGFYDYFLMI